MSGPCSMPAGDKSRWEEMNEIVCGVHYHCDSDPEKSHEFITYRLWLAKRGRLTTGKTR